MSSVNASPTSASTVGPSEKTLQSLPNRLRAFTKEALPFSGVAVDLTSDAKIDISALTQLIEPRDREYRKELKKFLATNPVMKEKTYVGLTLEQQRETVLKQVIALRDNNMYQYSDALENTLRFITFMETCSYHSHNLVTKISVNFGLYGVTIKEIGEKQQFVSIIDKMHSLETLGAFALTELGHGSNARFIETEAVYDPTTKEFIINSPTETAQKIWIGNAACHCNRALVFAQLKIKGKEYGVHAFDVPIRGKDKKELPGVRTKDCGVKMGLNGIDNGRLWFNKVRIPKSNLITRLCKIDDDGTYHSEISSNTRRFTALLSNLVSGRICTSLYSANYCKIGLSVAVRYALQRRQFGPEGKPEVLLLDFFSHQRRLFPLLAKTYAVQFALNDLKEKMFGKGERDMSECHVLAAGLKPYVTWHKVKTLQECREACGGNGFHADMRIGILKTDSDVDTTWEGDNSVLLQQVASSVIKELRQQMKSGGQFRGFLSYLGRQWSMEVRDKNIYKKLLTKSEHLTDYEFFKHCLEYREAKLLRGLVNRLQRNAKLGSFESWNQNLDVVFELGTATTERMILERFLNVISAAPQSVQPVLHILCSLYALTTIQQNMGFYMAFGYFSQAKSKSIWGEINNLCRALRPHALSLIEAFEIPEQLLGSEIASDYVKAYTWPNTPGGDEHERLKANL